MRDFLSVGRVLPLSAAVVLCASLAARAANPPGFIDDYDLALQRSEASGKPILAVFSGSDWCYWCRKLDQDFLQQSAFTAAVTNDIILLYVDSPKDTSILSEKARQANPGLVKKYGVRGFPSMMFLYGAKGQYVGDVKRKDMSPGDWGKYLADAARKMPLMLKHMKPWYDRAAVLKRDADRRVDEINAAPMTNEKKVEAIRQVVKEMSAKAEALLKDFEKIEFPPELQAEREKYRTNLNATINVNVTRQ